MLYGKWMNEWLELYVKISTKKVTYEKYRRQAEKYLLPELGGFELTELTAIRLQEFSASLSERKLAPSTMNGVLFLLRSSLRKAVSLGIAERQFTDCIVRPKLREKNISCFCKKEQKKIEKYVMEHDVHYLFGVLLSLYTGLRIGELLALTWDDIDLKKGTAAVTKSCRDSWEGGHYRKVLGTTKTQSSERLIPLPKQIVAYMRALKRERRGKFVVEGKTEYGAEVRCYQRTFGRILGELGIAHRGFHALRHTFATRALEVGMDVKTLSEVLGHKNPTVTLRRYAHTLLEHKTEMMNRVGQLLG